MHNCATVTARQYLLQNVQVAMVWACAAKKDNHW